MVLWHRLADVGLKHGQCGLARYALERGLAACPRHVAMMEKLAKVCFACMEVPCRKMEYSIEQRTEL